MKTKLKAVLAMMLILVLTISQAAYAKSDNGKGVGQMKTVTQEKSNSRFIAPGYLKKLDEFTIIDGKRIKVNHKSVPFDTPPIIKAGRTLIPIRAITESMGGLVFWEVNGTRVATIIDPKGEVMVEFDLSYDNGGHVYVYDAKEPSEFEPGYDYWDYRGEASLDVLPGLHENRTYVPLRFIGELFGLGVHYDPWTGLIDIIDGPVIATDVTEFAKIEDVPELVLVHIAEKGSVFVGIDGLTEGLNADYTTAAAIEPEVITDASLVLYLNKDLFEGASDGIYEFALRFKGGLEDIIRYLKITITE